MEGLAGGVYNARIAQAGIEQTQANTQQIQAQTMLSGIEAQGRKLQLEEAQKELARKAQLQQTLGQLKLGESTATNLNKAGEVMLQMGYVDQADKTFDTARKISENVYKGVETLSKNAENQSTALKNNVSAHENLLATAQSQESLDAINDRWEKTLGVPSPLKGRVYSPELMEGFRNNIVERRARYTPDQIEAREARLREEGESRAAARVRQSNIAQARLDSAKDKAKRGEKTGAAKLPTAAERKLGATTLNDYLKAVGVEGSDAISAPEHAWASLRIAEIAKQKIASNPGVTQEVAYRDALKDVVDSGDLKIEQPSSVGKFFGKSGKAKYEQGAGASVAKPATPSTGPAPGAVVNGYKFKGGNPNDKANWERAQ